MNLLFVVKSLALFGGGAERVLTELTAGLAGRGHRVCVASFDAPSSEDFYPLPPGVERCRLDTGDVRRPSGVGDGIRQVLALRRVLMAQRPDVAIGFMHSAYVPLCAAAVTTRIPVVASEHTVYGHYADKPLQAALLRLGAHFAVSFTAVSAQVRDTFPPAVRRKMQIVPNPVGAQAPGRADAIGGASKLLLTVGRVSPEKNHETLIRAFARIASRFPDWSLRIVGDGVLRPRLLALVASLGLQDRITLPGATNFIHDEYRAAQLFAMPSTYESFALATAEALAHGLPAVGFAECPGTNDLIVHGQNGLLVSGDDRVTALAEALTHLMASPDERKRMGDAGPLGLAAYTPARIVDRWVELLAPIAAGTAAPPGAAQPPGKTP